MSFYYFAIPVVFLGVSALPFLIFKKNVKTAGQAKKRFACNIALFVFLSGLSVAFAVNGFSLDAAAESTGNSVGTTVAVTTAADDDDEGEGEGESESESEVAPSSAIAGTMAQGMGFLAAALVTGIACLGAGIAVAAGAPAAIGAISENPQSFGKAIIFVVLGEGIAIYGLLISILIINKL